MDDRLLDQFVIKSNGSDEKMKGKLVKHDNKFVFVRIDSKLPFKDNILICELNFIPSSIPISMQKSALKFFKQHGIFDILINNSQYSMIGCSEYEFPMRLTEIR